MSYRQPWETGQAHVAELRLAAARERGHRQANGAPAPVRTAAATVVRTVADRLSRFADRLDTRTARSARFVPFRPDGA